MTKSHIKKGKLTEYRLKAALLLRNTAQPETRWRLEFQKSLSKGNGYHYLLTIIDRFTRWFVVINQRDTYAETISKTILQKWIAFLVVPQ